MHPSLTHSHAPHSHPRLAWLRSFRELALPLGLVLVLVGCAKANHPAVFDDSKDNAATQAQQQGMDLRSGPALVAETADDSTPALEEALGKSMGEFHMTYYWIASERKLAKGTHAIVDKSCKRISRVSKRFKKRLTLEGSGKLKDGRLVTTAGGCQCEGPCFWVADEKYPWGAGVAQRPLSPFESIAVDPRHIKIGTSLYVAELDGLTMPGIGDSGGFVHDGCVVADDRGGGVRGQQIDFFAAQRGHYKNFFKRHKLNRVTVFAGGEHCQDHAEEHDSQVLAVRGSS